MPKSPTATLVKEVKERFRNKGKQDINDSPLQSKKEEGFVLNGESVMIGDPEISFGTGRGQVKLKGSEAIEAGGWALRLLLLARAVSVVLKAIAVLGGVAVAHLLLQILSS
jgi:hypothetical protein